MSHNEMHTDWKQSAKKQLLSVAQMIDRVCSTESALAPPRTLYHQYGSGNFFDVGLQFFRYLLDHCNLQRNSHILDVGCGAGRIAMPLQFFFSDEGRYEGFDIMPDGITHCTEMVTPEFPNFRFRKADIFNKYYNPHGAQQPENFVFPHPDASFDIVISTSVMTHLRPAAAARYISETARVLKPGGISLHTFFLLDDFARAQIAAGKGTLDFRPFGDYMTNDPDFPEKAIALPEGAVRTAYGNAGLVLNAHRGSWCSRPDPLSFQDIIIAKRPEATD